MSISGTLFNAQSGLIASARIADSISQNVSNAMTEGFGRREVELSAASLNGRGSGVRVASVQRMADLIAIADRRLAQADTGRTDALSNMYSRLESVIGIPGETGSLSDQVSAFEAALAAAESRPDSAVRLQYVVYAARDLVGKTNQISDATQTIRVEADKSISNQVGTLNDTLAGVAELNRDILLQTAAGNNANGLMDQRQILVDRIAGIIPLKVYPREHDQIAITSAGGAVLLDGTAAEFAFTPVGQITPDMTLGTGALSGLELKGKPVEIGSGTGLLAAGALAAAFEIRDTLAPFASAQADAFARNLMERFEDPALDATLGIGDPGLFTDAGARFDTLNEVGIAGRLDLNNSVDPQSGGALWRIRDGLGATSPGNVGDNTMLAAFAGALTNEMSPASGQFSTGFSDLSELSGDLAALNSGSRLSAETAHAFAQSRFRELSLIEMESGVDMDQEMQKLLMVEQTYAANARVIATVDEMLRTLLEI